MQPHHPDNSQCRHVAVERLIQVGKVIAAQQVQGSTVRPAKTHLQTQLSNMRSPAQTVLLKQSAHTRIREIVQRHRAVTLATCYADKSCTHKLQAMACCTLVVWRRYGVQYAHRSMRTHTNHCVCATSMCNDVPEGCTLHQSPFLLCSSRRTSRA